MMVLVPMLRWWLLLELVGLVGLPISMVLLRALPGRGVCFRRPVGLLLSAYVFWLLVTLGLLQNTTASAALSLGIVALVSLVLVWRQGQSLIKDISRLRRIILIEALLFLASFVLFGLFRAYNPEIAATEKPMEFAFLNGILQSRTFPPHDPWLAGYSISYYYLGYVMSAMLTRLSALPSDITFNLTGVSLFALTVSGSFSLVWNLVASGRGDDPLARQGAARYGLLGAVLVAIMGNLEGVLEMIRARGLGSEAFYRWFDVRNLGPSAPSSTWYPDDMWWWWRASRVIHDRDLSGATQEVISEFPFFSFLLGDNHPHVLALPFVLLALALALNLMLLARQREESEDQPCAGPRQLSSLLALLQRCSATTLDLCCWGLILGALAFLNTWDYPIYLALFAGALAIARYRHRADSRWLADSVIVTMLLGAIGLLAYFPFFLSLRSQAGGIGLVPTHIKTQYQQFLLMFGVQFSLVLLFLATVLRTRWAQLPAARPSALALAWGAVLGLATVAALAATWWAAALCFFTLGLAGFLLIDGTASARRTAAGTSPALLFALLMVVIALLLIVSVEFVYLRDVFDSRMNTVFKFYYQGWLLLSLAGAYGVYHVLRELQGQHRIGKVLKGTWLAFSALLIVGGLSYTAAATVSKANAFAGPATLNGTDYVARQRPQQYALIQWLRSEASPDAIIVEAAGGSYTTQNWISAHTGLQSVLGWAGHERQWRGSGELPAARDAVVQSIYTAFEAGETRRLLETYGVDYVVVGPDERDKYGVGPAVLDVLDSVLVRTFENDAYIVYGRAW